MTQRSRTDHATVSTTAGPIELPIRYSAATMAGAFFTGDLGAATRLVAPMELVPVRLRGRSVVSLTFYAYHNTSIGPYNEVGLSVLARPRGSRGLPAAVQLVLAHPTGDAGFAVLDLPVTTGIADAAGREIWGYPKFVTTLPIELGDRTFDGRVNEPGGGLICALRGEFGRGCRVRNADLVTYTTHLGRRWRTQIATGGVVRAHRGSGLRLSLGPSVHPMRGHLGELGLAETHPFAFFVSRDLASQLPAGQAT